MQLMGLYPDNINATLLMDLTRRQLLCDFLAGSLLIVLAREEGIVEKQVRVAFL